MRARALALLAALLVAGCGGDEDRSGGPSPAAVVPPDARGYVEVDRAVLERLTRVEGWRREVEPWLGGRLGAFVAGGRLGLVLPARDAERARAYARREDGLFVGGAVVLSGSLAVQEAVRRAAAGSSLADTPRYERLAGEEGEGFGFGGDVTAVIRLEDDRAVADVRGLARPAGTTPDLGALPESAVIALASPDLGRDLRALIGASAVARRLLERIPVDVDAGLGAIGAGRIWAAEDGAGGLSAVPDDLPLLVRLIRQAARAERAAGKSPDLRLPTSGPKGAFAELYADGYSAGVEDHLLDIDVGTEVPRGSLDAKPVFQDAERALGGPPTALLDLSALERDVPALAVRYVAARAAGRDRLRVVVARDL